MQQELGGRHAGWRFEPGSNTLTSPGGQPETLSTAEAQLLSVLLAHPNHILTREQLLDAKNRRISIILLKETVEQAYERGAFKEKVQQGSKLDTDLKKQIETFKKSQGAVQFP